MPFKDLREFLQKLEAEGRLLRIKKEVDPKHEISAVIVKAGKSAVFCEKVKGYDIPVLANVFGDEKSIELALEMKGKNPLEEYSNRTSPLLPASLGSDGPVKENVILGNNIDLLGMLPIPIINEKDGGHYISFGIVIAKDPELGTNLSIHRIQVKGKRRAGIAVSEQQHLYLYFKRAEEKNKPLDIAVVIGCDPALHVASQVTGSPELDEYAVAGALRGGPVQTVKCETVDVEVPAQAEIVLEGRILPHLREPEGPFGEFSGYYGPAGDRPVIEFTGLTHRNRPIFQTTYLGMREREFIFLTSLPKKADLYAAIKKVVPEVKAVHLTEAGCGGYHAVASIRKRAEDQGKLALGVILLHKIGVKHAVVVDEDIDVHNLNEVEWAVATRSQFDRDALVLTDLLIPLDPSTSFKRKTGSLTSKLGIDATRPLGLPYPEVADIPAELLRQVEENWEEYLRG